MLRIWQPPRVPLSTFKFTWTEPWLVADINFELSGENTNPRAGNKWTGNGKTCNWHDESFMNEKS